MGYGISTSFITGNEHSHGAYKKPQNVEYDKKFVVKVQATASNLSPILIYDETRECEFHLNHGQPGFSEILTVTRKEKVWEGRKTYMKASFDRSGRCTVYPAYAGVKSRYKW